MNVGTQSGAALDGIRVLDLGTFIAGPFTATLLGEFGAEVIKVEPPGAGDSMRRLGTDTECGDTLFWLSEARNKKCVAVDMRKDAGRAIVRKLAARCDVVVENFRPGNLEKWGLGYDQLKRDNPGVVLVRISAYGQDGPMRGRPGFARVAHAFSGLAYLAGEPGRVPVVPGSTSLADYMAGLYGAIGALIALRARERTGEGQVVDLALYESVFRVLDELVPAFQRFGHVRERMGADIGYVCPHSHYETGDGKWIALACSNDDMFARLAGGMGMPGLASDAMYGRKDKRLAARDEVNRIVAAWVKSYACSEVLAVCERADVPASLIYSIADIFEDAQYRARGNIRTHASRIGNLAVPDVVPRLSATPGAIRWLGASVGQHSEDVLRGVLAMNDDEIAALYREGTIG
jgi:crotonobetainyl-CoA:carnitine CoA-transferase CaiB-like acyl-CoA transferase